MGERVLVVGPAWVGDMIMAHSLFRVLAQEGAQIIDVVAPGWSLPLLARMPEGSEGVGMPMVPSRLLSAVTGLIWYRCPLAPSLAHSVDGTSHVRRQVSWKARLAVV